MLPLLRDDLHIVLAPSQLSTTHSVMALTRRGLQRRVLSQADAHCPEAAPGTPAWSGALHALEQSLRAMSGARANLHVILSSRFVRYAIVPWQAGLKDSEDRAYVRHYFAQMFGSNADAWDICIGTARDGQPRLASAIDAALLLALRELCGIGAIRLKAVRPQLATIFDHCRRRLPASGWIVLAEMERLCVGLFENGNWLSIRTLRTGKDWLQELPALLAREACLANPAGEISEVFLWAPDQASGTALPDGRFRFHALPPPHGDRGRGVRR